MDTTESDLGSGDTIEHWEIYEYRRSVGLVPFKMEWTAPPDDRDESGVSYWRRQLSRNGFELDPDSREMITGGPFRLLLHRDRRPDRGVFGLAEIVWGNHSELVIVPELVDWFDLHEYLLPFATIRNLGTPNKT